MFISPRFLFLIEQWPNVRFIFCSKKSWVICTQKIYLTTKQAKKMVPTYDSFFSCHLDIYFCVQRKKVQTQWFLEAWHLIDFVFFKCGFFEAFTQIKILYQLHPSCPISELFASLCSNYILALLCTLHAPFNWFKLLPTWPSLDSICHFPFTCLFVEKILRKQQTTLTPLPKITPLNGFFLTIPTLWMNPP